MDLVGKTFYNARRIVHVDKQLEKYVYRGVLLDKSSYGYLVADTNYYQYSSEFPFSECPDADIIPKFRHMLNMNYVACLNIVNNVKTVESSNYHIKVTGHIVLWGHYTIDISENCIWLKPIDEPEQHNMCEAITEEDYYKIFNRVKKLKEDLDKLWTDVV